MEVLGRLSQASTTAVGSSADRALSSRSSPLASRGAAAATASKKTSTRKMKIPAFQRLLPAARYVAAVAASGFSTNFMTRREPSDPSSAETLRYPNEVAGRFGATP